MWPSPSIVSGLTAQTSDPINFRHVTAMAEYAFRIKQQLNYVNEHSFNNFQLRVGKLLKDSFILWRNIQPFSNDAPPLFLASE